MAKKKTKTKNPFLWSILFIALALGVNVYIANMYLGMTGSFISWPMAALVSSAIALALVIYERNSGKLGKGFSWGSCFVALTLAFSIYIAAMSGYAFWPFIALASSVIALVLLINEKKDK